MADLFDEIRSGGGGSSKPKPRTTPWMSTEEMDPGLGDRKVKPGTGLGDKRPKNPIALHGPLGGPMSSSPLYGTAGGGGGGGGAADAFLNPESNPNFLAALADIDASEATAIGGIRARQDAARRSFADFLEDLGERERLGGVRTREAQEGRGLLRSGATERLLLDVAKNAHLDRGRGEVGLADQISDLERAVAEASASAARARSSARLAASGADGVL